MFQHPLLLCSAYVFCYCGESTRKIMQREIDDCNAMKFGFPNLMAEQDCWL